MRPVPPAEALWSVPRCWPGETVVILGGGESMTADGGRALDYVRRRHEAGACRVVAINRCYVIAPWADWLFACDPGWFWTWCSGPAKLWGQDDADALDVPSLKVSVWSYADNYLPQHGAALDRLVGAGVHLLLHGGEGWHQGLSGDPGWVRGTNGCQQLLSGPVPYSGAKRSILLGIDMKGGHWHREWPGYDEGRLAHRYENYAPEHGRVHRAAIEVLGREVELGWYGSADKASAIELLIAQNIARGCPCPEPRIWGDIPRFATLLPGLAELEHEVFNCSPASALKTFPQVRLEDVL